MALRGRVRCKTCQQDKLEFSAAGACELLRKGETAALACHALPPCSSRHELVALYELPAAAPLRDVRPLRIECLHAKCKQKAALEMLCPIELVNSAAICFHAAHEGHPFALAWGDEFKVTSPA